MEQKKFKANFLLSLKKTIKNISIFNFKVTYFKYLVNVLLDITNNMYKADKQIFMPKIKQNNYILCLKNKNLK